MLVAAISSYREGPNLLSTIASAQHVGLVRVLVFDGPAGLPHPSHGHDPELSQAWPTEQKIDYHSGAWPSDADKRTDMLYRAKGYPRKPDEPLWLLWLDGDELLLWGEYLPDMTRRAEAETGAGGFTLRVCELDGSVNLAHGKIVRADLLARYLESSYQVELANGMIVALPNTPLCSAGGIPLRPDDIPSGTGLELAEQNAWLSRYRPPLQGEPHILHRPTLRPPDREVERLHEREPSWYAQQMPEVERRAR